MNNNIWILTVLTGLLFACAATLVDASPGSAAPVALFSR
jgi:hypothetical protein